ncbi:hypothetical protein PhCBS80983_g06333 [Powellomyces hirtus]|uniref:Uncharacterized protein n=1 Tax=Powellomyces hirtus TaxID=109895 RepID=A0A507DPU3_9FUNG|nr:hypothetical protein PhCBS80983_g06333 [Powellomyces hirtus]
MAPHTPSLHLFRDALRMIRLHCSTYAHPTKAAASSAPPSLHARHDPHRRKLASNVRQLFELYREERDAEKVETLLEKGRHDLEVMGWLAAMEGGNWQQPVGKETRHCIEPVLITALAPDPATAEADTAPVGPSTRSGTIRVPAKNPVTPVNTVTVTTHTDPEDANDVDRVFGMFPLPSALATALAPAPATATTPAPVSKHATPQLPHKRRPSSLNMLVTDRRFPLVANCERVMEDPPYPVSKTPDDGLDVGLDDGLDDGLDAGLDIAQRPERPERGRQSLEAFLRDSSDAAFFARVLSLDGDSNLLNHLEQ